MEPNAVQNMKDVINEYNDDLKGTIDNITSKIELANSFGDSCIAKTMKEYLEAIVGEINKVTAYVDSFNEELIVSSGDGNTLDNVTSQDVAVVELPTE